MEFLLYCLLLLGGFALGYTLGMLLSRPPIWQDTTPKRRSSRTICTKKREYFNGHEQEGTNRVPKTQV